MARDNENRGRDIPGAVMNAGVRSSRILNRLPGMLRYPIRTLVTGSDSPSYVDAVWATAHHVVGALPPDGWVRGTPDPEAGWRPVTKKHAVVVGISRLALAHYMVENELFEAEEAVAFAYRGKVRVGVLPNGFGEAQNGYFSAAMRQGSEAAVFAIGPWMPEQKTLYVPPYGMERLGDMVPTSALHLRFPGTPLT